MPTARRCTGCGATLNDPPAGATTLTCRFCGLTHDLGVRAGAVSIGAPVVIEVGQTLRRTSAVAGAAILGTVGLALGIGGYVAWRVTRETGFGTQLSTLSPRVPEVPAKTSRPAERLLPPADLATLTTFGWYPLDVPPPPGGFDAFEPVAALPWAMDIARAWASDAVLTRIDIGRVDTTGVVTLSGETTSGYRFSSPGRQQRWKQETDAGSKSQTRVGLMVQLQGTTVRALTEEGRNSSDRPAPAPAHDPAAAGGVGARQSASQRRGRSAVLQRLPDPPAARGLGVVLQRAVWRQLSARQRHRRPHLPVLAARAVFDSAARIAIAAVGQLLPLH